MRIVCGLDFDAGAWPGPVPGDGAAAGVEWTGLAGLVDRLESMLGLGAPPVRAVERLVATASAGLALDGFWSRSAAADPFGTARRLLDWRDRLRLGGWRGEPLSDRLRALSRVTEEAPSGLPDRLDAVRAALTRRSASLAEVVLCEPHQDLPKLLRDTLAALAARGTTVRTLAAQDAEAAGDLRAARLSAFAPRGDGTFQLLRPWGPLAAAESVAAWLAAAGPPASTVILGASASLDAALHRHGLPATGAAGACGSLAALIPLALELGWEPQDPRIAAELLALTPGPVPAALARRLLGALREWPVIGGDDWRQALAAGLEAIADASRRERIEARVAGLFTPSVPRGGSYPRSEIERRLRLVESWMEGRLALDPPARARTGFLEALDRAADLRRACGVWGGDALAEAELRAALAESSAGASSSRLPAGAGAAAIGRPGGLTGEAEVVVWWGFTHTSAARPRDLPLAAGERQALRAAGIEPPDPGREALALARRFRRPLELTRRALLLVCPETGDDGEEAHPHPLWDEIAARARRPGDLAPVVVRSPILLAPAARNRPSPRSVPAPRRRFRVPPARLAPPQRESPTSLEALLGCPLRWALERVGRLRAEPPLELPSGSALKGSLVHLILAEVLPASSLATSGGAPAGAPATVRAAALAAFDRRAPHLAAELFLPGAEAERESIRRIVGASAEELTRILSESRLRVAAMESRREGSLDGVATLGGRIDLVTEPVGVVDLKLGAARSRRESLAAGTALQLAAYAHLLGAAAGGTVPVAYFILATQRLLSTGVAFARAERIDGPDAAETWRAALAALGERRAEIAGGLLEAPANPDESGATGPRESAVEDGRLLLAPPCAYCDFGALCGLTVAEERG